MHMDLEEAKRRLENVAGHYQDKFHSYSENRTHKKLECGLDALDEVNRQIEGISDGVNGQIDNLSKYISEGNTATNGALELVRRVQGQEYQDNEFITGLRQLYEGKKRQGGLLSKFGATLPFWHKEMTLKDALGIVEDVAKKIPDYMKKIEQDVAGKKNDLTNLKAYLREQVEENLEEIPKIEEDLEEIKGIYKELNLEYEKLEQQRKENSSKGIRTDPQIIKKLGLLEQTISEIDEKKSDLQSKREHVEEYIGMRNNQIQNITELTKDIINKSQKTIRNGLDLVEVQVPYLVAEVRAQKSQIRALTETERIAKFLEGQQRSSGPINQRILIASEFVGKRVEEVKEQIKNRGSVLEAGPKSKRIASSQVTPDSLDKARQYLNSIEK